jgi:hypothetical protein
VGAQYAHIWTTFALIDIAPASAQNGGYTRGAAIRWLTTLCDQLPS